MVLTDENLEQTHLHVLKELLLIALLIDLHLVYEVVHLVLLDYKHLAFRHLYLSVTNLPATQVPIQRVLTQLILGDETLFLFVKGVLLPFQLAVENGQHHLKGQVYKTRGVLVVLVHQRKHVRHFPQQHLQVLKRNLISRHVPRQNAGQIQKALNNFTAGLTRLFYKLILFSSELLLNSLIRIQDLLLLEYPLIQHLYQTLNLL